MKYRLSLLLFIFALTSMACQAATPTVDTNATVAAAIQATKDAEPTATPVPTDTPTLVPSPTDTPTPAPTETPLPTETPSLTPTLPSLVTVELEDGWTRYELPQDGFACAFPPDWYRLDDDPETVDAIVEQVSGDKDQVRFLIQSQLTQFQLFSSLRLFTIYFPSEVTADTRPVTGNIQVIEMPIEAELTDEVAQMVATQLESLFNLNNPIDYQRVTLQKANVEAVIFKYSITSVSEQGQSVSPLVYQFMIIKGKFQYIITFGSDLENEATNIPIFNEIAQTFEFIEP